jgi:hypothetical protein
MVLRTVGADGRIVVTPHTSFGNILTGNVSQLPDASFMHFTVHTDVK